MNCNIKYENLSFPMDEQSIIIDDNKDNKKDEQNDTLLFVIIMLVLSGVFTFILLYNLRFIS